MVDTLYEEQRSGYIHDSGLGLIHACYGQGVGKTTRSIGLSVRAAASGLRVVFVQWLKSGDSAEVAWLSDSPNIEYRCPGPHPFIMSRGPQPVHFDHASRALDMGREAVQSGADVLVCDEILTALFFKVLEVKQVTDLIGSARGRVEMVMTGAVCPPEIFEQSDYVTQFVQEKHPYYSGGRARKGIEY
jgi:cob(I)alamin adenosyltransferase